MNFPENVKYTKEHEWIRLEGDVAYVGITDYAQEQLGDIVFVDIQSEGETLAADEVFGTIEVVKTISDLFLARRRRNPGTKRGSCRPTGTGKQRSVRRRLAHQNETGC